ncbi:hypothetical protein ACHAW6_012458 [Cyclotella cf. meneghiniana]
MMGFNHRTPLEILTHLQVNGGDLEYLDWLDFYMQHWDFPQKQHNLPQYGRAISLHSQGGPTKM